MIVIDLARVSELVNRTQALVSSGAYTARDAIPLVLNGARLIGKTEIEKKRRAAYRRRLEARFPAAKKPK